MGTRRAILSVITATAANLLLAFVTYALARGIFLALNYRLLAPALSGSIAEIFKGSLLFDASAIAYTNAVWLLLFLLPIHIKERPGYHRALRILFTAVNTAALALNLADAVYFPYTLRRTTSTVFNEFSHESNLASIIGSETLSHWYLVLITAAAAYAIWRLYRTPRLNRRHINPLTYNISLAACLILAGGLSVAAMRGGFTTAVRPITVSNAAQYVSRPTDAALVLNTPFSLIRTIGKNVFTNPNHFPSREACQAVYTPLHTPADTLPMQRKNIVILIVESFGKEYIGALNHGQFHGYTPFTDSLIAQSLTFTRTYANGRKSIDAMPSILSGIPMMIEPFFVTPASMNKVGGIADLLNSEGYTTAFFHGAQNGSMGFEAFARATGFQHYFGRTEFEADTRFGGNKDFDGTWAIWDEPFLQFYCQQMSAMRQPFMTAVFTASSHHPFNIPNRYLDSIPQGTLPIHRCIRYTDLALRRFFETAQRQPWFRNTIFVLTADHTNMSQHDLYQTPLGTFAVPIIIYDPSGQLPTGTLNKTAQQTDILPTLMGIIHYPHPYVAFGIDLLNTPAEQTWAFSYLNGTYQMATDRYLLQFDGKHTTAVYALSDSLMEHNLLGRIPEQNAIETRLKALIQSYMDAMINDRLTPQTYEN